jgi:hypothetical protein
VKARATKRFWACFARLPPDIQERARAGFERWSNNPAHPGLQFKRVHDRRPIYSVRIARGWRAVGVLRDDTMIWFWVGSHADYERLLSQM